ncbi:hypothetical protein K456DRAFT_37031 [Colletotrichum gloeosporioides 23]|nr:hypothetical protein K456DRAFT_37031 [Colletotrichum gloeosporioides 23]
MKFPTFIAATILLGLGANAAAVPDTDAAMAAGIGGNKHYGKCLKGPNQCVLNQKHGERRIDCRKPNLPSDLAGRLHGALAEILEWMERFVGRHDNVAGVFETKHFRIERRMQGDWLNKGKVL